ncbi:MAG: DUF6338 family protein [Terricaulis sp.]
MPNLGSPEAAYYLLALSVPAIVFLFVRIQFTHGRMPKAGDAALYYLAITAIYYGVAYPFVLLAIATPGNWFSWWLGWLSLAFLIPAVLGAIAGWAAQRDLLYRALRAMGLKTVHMTPTAWEWRFGQCPGEWVVVTLTNGNAYGAKCGSGSFISTEPSERDLYLECVYDIADDGTWTERGYGMLISAGEVSTVEFSLRDGNGPDEQVATTPAP